MLHVLVPYWHDLWSSSNDYVKAPEKNESLYSETYD
jgi:hypothetical protein